MLICLLLSQIQFHCYDYSSFFSFCLFVTGCQRQITLMPDRKFQDVVLHACTDAVNLKPYGD